MGKLRQFYGGAGVPLDLDRDSEAPAKAWRSHRERLRQWLGSVPDSEWSNSTRCTLWDMTALAHHLVSGSQFLGYTLHKANTGTSTSLMQGFDTHETVQADAARFGDLTPDAARQALASKDASIEIELVTANEREWSAMAEAPPGQMPTHMAVNHFLLDSWVHEYDFMVPRGQSPQIDRHEAVVVVTYLIGLASLQTESRTPIELRLAHPEIQIGVDVSKKTTQVTVGSAPRGAAVIEGTVVDLVDRATGREAGPIGGDRKAMAVLDGFGALLAR